MYIPKANILHLNYRHNLKANFTVDSMPYNVFEIRFLLCSALRWITSSKNSAFPELIIHSPLGTMMF